MMSRWLMIPGLVLSLGLGRAEAQQQPPLPEAEAPKPPPVLSYLDNQTAREIPQAVAVLLLALQEPLLAGKDVSVALQGWIDGHRHLQAKSTKECMRSWAAAFKSLQQPPAPLKLPPVPPLPPAVKPELLGEFTLPAAPAGVRFIKLAWTTNGLRQLGVLVVPPAATKEKPLPLLVWNHGAAYGVPTDFLPILGQWADTGYVVLAPALRGEPLFCGLNEMEAPFAALNEKSGGAIENLLGEVDDTIAGARAARLLPFVRPGKYAVGGHSFGGGAALLATERDPEIACGVIYDGWLVNPFRYYWDRMRRGANNWLSWADFCEQPAADQLVGLWRRSAVHQAAGVKCPLQMFIGMTYDGSVFHQSYTDFFVELKRLKVDYTFTPIVGGGHNFILYTEDEQAKQAMKIQKEFLDKHFPPGPGNAGTRH
jgi:dienelactone hydrolase